jgi:hypothetical protein
MARIAGLKLIKSSTGKVTHVTLSMKHHGNILQDMIDAAELEEARKGDTISWNDAKIELNKVLKNRRQK